MIGGLSATDPDSGETLTFTLPDSPDGLFAIVDGNLVVNQVLDFEAGYSHDVTVRVTDSANNTFDKTFTISVTDMNEIAPVIVAINVQTPNGFNFENTNFETLLGNAVIQVGNSATEFTTINAAGDAKFVIDGTDLTYATDAQGRIHVTGGSITAVHWLTNSTNTALVDFTGFPAGSASALLAQRKPREPATVARSMP